MSWDKYPWHPRNFIKQALCDYHIQVKQWWWDVKEKLLLKIFKKLYKNTLFISLNFYTIWIWKKNRSFNSQRAIFQYTEKYIGKMNRSISHLSVTASGRSNICSETFFWEFHGRTNCSVNQSSSSLILKYFCFVLFYNTKEIYVRFHYEFGFHNLLFLDSSSLSHWNIQEFLKCKWWRSGNCSFCY